MSVPNPEYTEHELKHQDTFHPNCEYCADNPIYLQGREDMKQEILNLIDIQHETIPETKSD